MSRLLILFCIIFGALAKPPLEKCKITDATCMLNLSNQMYTTFFVLNNKLDPMHLDEIVGDLPTMNYKLADVTAKGFGQCKIEAMNLDFDKLILDTTYICPHLEMEGNYEVTGSLLNVPVEGNGNFTMRASQYSFDMHSQIEWQKNGEKSNIHIKSFDLKLNPREQVMSKIDNLFNGDQEKAERALKIFRDNWKEIIPVVHVPMFVAVVGKIKEAANDFFKNNAVEEYVIL